MTDKPIDPAVIAGALMASRQAADAICDRWSLALVLAALQGARRFGDLGARTGMASRLLTSRLASLQTLGVLAPLPYSLHPLRYEYRLSPMGEALADVVLQMMRWQQNWAVGPEPERIKALVCKACGASLTAREVVLKIRREALKPVPQRLTRHRRSTLDSDDSAKPSPLGPSLDIFGDRWGIEILLCFFFRLRRFSIIRQHTGIAANILSDRLARLTTAGVLVCDPDQRGYRLTEKGLDLYGPIVAIQDWADYWLKDRYRSPAQLIHNACTNVFHPARPDFDDERLAPLQPAALRDRPGTAALLPQTSAAVAAG